MTSSANKPYSGLTLLATERGSRELTASTMPAAVVTAKGHLAAAPTEPNASVLKPAIFNQN